MLPGECVHDVRTVCLSCCRRLDIEPLQSAAGWYAGFWCPECGPYSRETGYYKTMDEVYRMIEENRIEWR